MADTEADDVDDDVDDVVDDVADGVDDDGADERVSVAYGNRRPRTLAALSVATVARSTDSDLARGRRRPPQAAAPARGARAEV